MKKIILGLAACSLILTGCRRETSDSVNQDKIYAEYRIVYDEAADKSYGRATFHFSDALGIKLELTDPAEVQFNGTTMPWKNSLAYYENEYAGWQTQGTFDYTDLDGNSFANSVVSNYSIGVPSSLTTLNKSAAYTLTWDGPALQADEIVYVTINGINEGDIQTFSTDADGANSIILDKNKLEKLGTGTGKIFIERWSYQSIQEATSAGGAVWSRYIGTSKSISIQP